MNEDVRETSQVYFVLQILQRGPDGEWVQALGYPTRPTATLAWSDYDHHVDYWKGMPEEHKLRYGYDAREWLRVARIRQTVITETEVLERAE